MPAVAEEPSSPSAYGTTHIDPVSATQSCLVDAERESPIEHPVLLGKADLTEVLQGGCKLRIKNTFIDMRGENTPTPVNRRAFWTCPDMESEEVIQKSGDERHECSQRGAAQRSPSLESAPEGASRYVDKCQQAQDSKDETPSREEQFGSKACYEQARKCRQQFFNTEDLQEMLMPMSAGVPRREEPTRAACNVMYNTEDLRESLGQEPLQTRTTRNAMYTTEDLRESLCAANGGGPFQNGAFSAQAVMACASSGATQIQNEYMPHHAANRDVLTSHQSQAPVSLHTSIHIDSNQPTSGAQNIATAVPAQGFAANHPATFQFFSMNPYSPMDQMRFQCAQANPSALQHPSRMNTSIPPVSAPPTMAIPESRDAVPDVPAPMVDPIQENSMPPSNAEGTSHGEGHKGRRLRLWAHIHLHMEEKGFDLVPRLIGRRGENMRKIAEETNAKVRIRGKGSGHLEVDGKFEAPTPLMVAVTTDHEQQIAFSRAIEMILQQLRTVQQRYQNWCHKKNIVTEGPYFSIGLLSEGADKILANLLDGVPMSGPGKSRR